MRIVVCSQQRRRWIRMRTHSPDRRTGGSTNLAVCNVPPEYLSSALLAEEDRLDRRMVLK